VTLCLDHSITVTGATLGYGHGTATSPTALTQGHTTALTLEHGHIIAATLNRGHSTAATIDLAVHLI